MKLTNDGSLSILGADGVSKIVLPGDGTILSVGAWSHTGDISATGEVTGKSSTAPVALTTHLHVLQAPGSIETGMPLAG